MDGPAAQPEQSARGLNGLLCLAVLGLVAAAFMRWPGSSHALHPADVIFLVAAGLWIVSLFRGAAASSTPRLAPFAVPFMLLAGVAVTSSPELSSGVSGVAKYFAILVIGSTLIAQVAATRARSIAQTIAGATVVTVLVALVQYLRHADPVSVSGFLDSRTLYGLCVAAGTPFVISELWNADSSRDPLFAAGAFAFVFVAAITILSAPMFVLFALAALAIASRQNKVYIASVCAALALAVILIGTSHLTRDNKAALVDSVSTFDDAGHIRRNATEAYAAAHAIADRPLLGHGPGSYQSTVSSAQYRGALPPPAENRVERGSNPGYLVAAVELGVPAELLLAAMFVACGLGAVRSPGAPPGQPSADAAAIAAFTLAAGTMFTVTLINGPGFLMAAVMGLCVAARGEQVLMAGTAMPRKPWRSFIWKSGMVATALLVGVLLHKKPSVSADSYDDIAAADLSGSGRNVVVLEAEDCSTLVEPMRRTPRGDASAGACIGVDEGKGKPPAVEGSATFSVNIADHGRYRIWVRAWWSDGCANSVAASFDNQAAYLMGNDGNYHCWHWVRGPVTELRAGAHLLSLLQREDNMEIDEIALSNDDTFVPNGALAATQSHAEAGVRIADSKPVTIPIPPPAEPAKPPEPEPFIVQPKSTPTPVQTSVPVPAEPVKTPESAIRNPQSAIETPPKTDPIAAKIVAPKVDPPAGTPFLVGIGGAYRDGFEDHLVSMGVPYIRLRDDELEKIDALANVNVLMVSIGESSCNSSAFARTLYAFLKSGRNAIVEFPPVDLKPADDPEDLFFLRRPRENLRSVTLYSDDSIFFKGVPKSVTYEPDVYCNSIPATTDAPGAKIYGNISAYGSGRENHGALSVRKVGDGKLYYMGLTGAFSSMWRGRKVDPFVANIIRDAVGEKCCYPFANLKYAPRESASVKFSDDFMRQPGTTGGWKVLEGKFGLTGENGDESTVFSTHGIETSFAVIGNDNWKDYRVAASVLLKDGEAGVWQSTTGGGRLALRLREQGKSVALVLRVALDSNDQSQEKVLAETPINAYPKAWRRLALLRRKGLTEGFVDGERVIAIKNAPEPLGRCGLCVIKGDAFFDDFSAIDTAAVMPNRDVAPGEESSERCMVRYYQRCSEKMSVYSPQWFLKPHPIDQHYLQVALPLFKGGVLQLDGRDPMPIAASDDFSLIKLPAEKPGPDFDVALHTSGWRDYEFAGRVTDWYQTSGEWSQINRWSCNPEYEWFGGRGASGDAVLWTKRSVKGSAAMEVLMAPCANQTYHEEQGRDLNIVLFGNGRDLSDGYLFTVLSAGHGCQISRGGKVLASAPAPGPAASGHSLHHTWFSVSAVVSGKKIQMFFDRRLACECTDDQPLQQGKFGIWTRRNKISVARATLSDSDGE